MRGIRNWSVRTRLLIAFVGVLIPYLALAGIGAVGLQAVWQRVRAIHDEVAMEFVGIANLQLAVTQLVMPANDYLITGDPAERELFEQRLARAYESLARAETIVFHDQEERRLFEAVKGQVPQIEALSREILAIPDPRVNRAAPAKMKALDRVSDEAAATLGGIRDIALREIEENIERSSAVIRWVAAVGVAAVLLSVAGGVGLALIFSTWLSRPILAIAQTSRQMAEGDLSQRVEARAGGELGETARAFNEMAERLEHAAIERARLLEEVKKEAQFLAALAEISRALTSTLEPAALFSLVCEKMMTLFQVDGCYLWILDEAGRELVSAAAFGHKANAFDSLRVSLDREDSVSARAARTRKPQVVQDVVTSELAGAPLASLFESRSLLALPLMTRESLVGVIILNDIRRTGRFNNMLIQRAEIFGDQAAIAIENARLYSDLEKSKQKIAELHNLGMILQEPLSLKDRLDLILTGAETVLGFDRINILLPDSDKKMLRAIASRGTREPLERLQVPLGPEGGGIAKAFLECKDIVWEGTGPVPDGWRLAHPYSEIEAFRSRAFVNVPLIVRGTVIGVLGADNKFSQKPILAETIHLLKDFAAHAAITIDNARLYDEVSAHAEEMERKVEERTRALKETQVQLIQSGKLAAVGTLAAGVAHELNQPLMVIRGYAQELLADKRLADQEVREDLRRIEAQTTRMVAIITHLRDFSRQSKGRREPTDLNHVVTQAFTFLAQQLKVWNIEVIQELDPALPTVWADPLQIEQILLNLVTNARDAMEATGSGTITIHTGRTQDGRVALTITDTGPGIPPDLQGRIFDPFFTTKEVGKGTGLGLSICHGILEEHGGELRVQSPVADGRGARFTIMLPLSLRDSAGRVRA